MSINYEIISFVARSKRRLEILNNIREEPTTQTKILKVTKMYKSHVSRSIKELMSKELIECKNPNDRAYKFYSITKLGIEILKKIKEIKI